MLSLIIIHSTTQTFLYVQRTQTLCFNVAVSIESEPKFLSYLTIVGFCNELPKNSWFEYKVLFIYMEIQRFLFELADAFCLSSH